MLNNSYLHALAEYHQSDLRQQAQKHRAAEEQAAVQKRKTASGRKTPNILRRLDAALRAGRSL